MLRTGTLLTALFFLTASAFAQPAGTADDASKTGATIACSGGKAAAFDCQGVDLHAQLTSLDLGGTGFTSLNDLWGWVDPETGREYALVGRTDGTAFVDVTDPINPVFLGDLPRTPGSRPNFWRDLKAYQNHVYIVADGAGNHGMQVFDLTALRGLTGPPVTFEETAHYDLFASAHNIAINEDTGFAYVMGGSQGPCGGGLHMIDLATPDEPVFAGCFQHLGTGRAGTGYVHDAQCVVYHGPDADHAGQEVCFNANETALSIADVTEKTAPLPIAVGTYPNVGYAHQGWLTEDHRYFLLGDELDERNFGFNSRTIVWDVTDLDDPQVLTEYFGPVATIDHNIYIVGRYAFQANYTSGLRILDLADIENPAEVAFFDTYTLADDVSFEGAWSVYPFLPSGNLLVSSQGEGLFVLEAPGLTMGTVGTEADETPAAFALGTAFPNPFRDAATIPLTLDAPQHLTVAVYDALGREVARLHDGLLAPGTHTFRFDGGDLPPGAYVVRATGDTFGTTRLLTRVR